MMKLKKQQLAMVAGLLSGLVGSAPHSMAATIGIYDGPTINLTSPACLTVGDAVSCSAPLLNYLAGLGGTTQTTNGGYVLSTPQGALDNYLVVADGGNAAPNGNNGAPVVVEDGFKTNGAGVGSASFVATGKATGSGPTLALGNMADPVNNALVTTLGAAADAPGTWDASLQWLKDGLTVNGIRRTLMIGFDYNQPQNSTTSLNYWSLITVRDVQGILPDINYEIRSNPTNQSFSAFTTTKNFFSQPSSTDFGLVNGVTCVNTTTQQILPIPGGSCPAGYDLALNNAQSTSTTEIFAFLPELDTGLEALIAQGYDVVSARVLMGCFGRLSTGANAGLGYLADEATGATNNCDSGGFGDIFLLAGAARPTNVPEPGSIALLGLGLLGFMATVRRRKQLS